MAKIFKDIIGLYILSDNLIARPINNKSKFKENEEVKSCFYEETICHRLKSETNSELWTSNDMKADVYLYARDKYFSKLEFDKFIIGFQDAMNTNVENKKWKEYHDQYIKINLEMHSLIS